MAVCFCVAKKSFLFSVISKS